MQALRVSGSLSLAEIYRVSLSPPAVYLSLSCLLLGVFCHPLLHPHPPRLRTPKNFTLSLYIQENPFCRRSSFHLDSFSGSPSQYGDCGNATLSGNNTRVWRWPTESHARPRHNPNAVFVYSGGHSSTWPGICACKQMWLSEFGGSGVKLWFAAGCVCGEAPPSPSPSRSSLLSTVFGRGLYFWPENVAVWCQGLS